MLLDCVPLLSFSFITLSHTHATALICSLINPPQESMCAQINHALKKRKKKTKKRQQHQCTYMGLFLWWLGRILATLGYRPATITAFRSFSFSVLGGEGRCGLVKRNRRMKEIRDERPLLQLCSDERRPLACSSTRGAVFLTH